MGLQAFLDQTKVRNAWIVYAHYRVYVRKAFRNIDGELRSTLDIAQIEVKEGMRGCGIGSAILRITEELNPFYAVYIENVLNDRFATRLMHDGWTPLRHTDNLCFVKLKTHKEGEACT